MSALWISHVAVSDAEAYGRYARAAGPVIAAHGGQFLARGGAHVTLEGADRPRHVVIRFPSLSAAQACYDDPAYRTALSHAEGASVRQLILVEETAAG